MKVRGIIFVVLACFGWGTIGVFNAGLTEMGYDSVTLASIRCIVSAATLLSLKDKEKKAENGKARAKMSYEL